MVKFIMHYVYRLLLLLLVMMVKIEIELSLHNTLLMAIWYTSCCICITIAMYHFSCWMIYYRKLVISELHLKMTAKNM